MYSATLTLPERVVTHSLMQILGQAFEELALSHASKRNTSAEKWHLTWFFHDQPHTDFLASTFNDFCDIRDISKQIPSTSNNDWHISEIADDINWLEAVYMQNPPITLDPFFIYGSHYDGPIPDDLITLNIDAVTAFGGGDHGTTQGCLLAMSELKESGVCPWNILDMGTGSGILALAAWTLWKTPILGVDIKADAIDVCKRHAAQNNIKVAPQNITFIHGDGFNTSILNDKKPFDLIIANILAGPLKTMADDMYDACDDNGYIILSGILNKQEQDITGVYKNSGFKLVNKRQINGWSTLVMQKHSHSN